MKKYRSLRFIVGLSYLLAALVFIASIVVGLSSKSQGNMGYLFLFGGIFLSFSIVVYAQLLEVFVDIARNTGEAVNLLKNKQQ